MNVNAHLPGGLARAVLLGALGLAVLWLGPSRGAAGPLAFSGPPPAAGGGKGAVWREAVGAAPGDLPRTPVLKEAEAPGSFPEPEFALGGVQCMVLPTVLWPDAAVKANVKQHGEVPFEEIEKVETPVSLLKRELAGDAHDLIPGDAGSEPSAALVDAGVQASAPVEEGRQPKDETPEEVGTTTNARHNEKSGGSSIEGYEGPLTIDADSETRARQEVGNGRRSAKNGANAALQQTVSIMWVLKKFLLKEQRTHETLLLGSGSGSGGDGDQEEKALPNESTTKKLAFRSVADDDLEVTKKPRGIDGKEEEPTVDVNTRVFGAKEKKWSTDEPEGTETKDDEESLLGSSFLPLWLRGFVASLGNLWTPTIQGGGGWWTFPKNELARRDALDLTPGVRRDKPWTDKQPSALFDEAGQANDGEAYDETTPKDLRRGIFGVGITTCWGAGPSDPGRPCTATTLGPPPTSSRISAPVTYGPGESYYMPPGGLVMTAAVVPKPVLNNGTQLEKQPFEHSRNVDTNAFPDGRRVTVFVEIEIIEEDPPKNFYWLTDLVEGNHYVRCDESPRYACQKEGYVFNPNETMGVDPESEASSSSSNMSKDVSRWFVGAVTMLLAAATNW